MSDFIDYYEVLGVPPDASLKVIQAAYREAMKKYHPDRVAAVKAQLLEKGISHEVIEYLITDKLAEAEVKCRAFNQAYDILSDRAQRRAFHEAWKTATTPKPTPKLVVTPSQYKVSHLRTDETRSLTFIITNKGGDLTGNLVIKNWDKTTWITNRQIDADEDKIFPIKASFTIDPKGLKPGHYQETIVIETDGSRAELAIELEVTKPVDKPAPTTSYTSPTPSRTTAGITHPPGKFWWNDTKRFTHHIEIKLGIWLCILLMARAGALPHVPEEFLSGSGDRYLWALILFWPLHIGLYRFLKSVIGSVDDFESGLALAITISLGFAVVMAIQYILTWGGLINPLILILIELPLFLSVLLIQVRYMHPSTQFNRLVGNIFVVFLTVPAVILIMTNSDLGSFQAGVMLAWTINLYLFAV